MAHAAHPAPATRPALEVADILRAGADSYRETHRLSVQQQRVVSVSVEPSCIVRVSAHPMSAPAAAVSVSGALPSTSTRTERCTSTLHRPLRPLRTHTRAARSLDASGNPFGARTSMSPSPGSRRVWASTRLGGVFQLTAQRPVRFLRRYSFVREPSPPRSSRQVLALRGVSRPLAFLVGAVRVPRPRVPPGVLGHPLRPSSAFVEQPRASCANRPFMRFQRFAGLPHRRACERDRDVRNPRCVTPPPGELAVEPIPMGWTLHRGRHRSSLDCDRVDGEVVERTLCVPAAGVSAVPEMLVDGRNEGAAFLKVSSSASY